MFTMHSDSGMKKNIIIPTSRTYLKLEIILLSEVSETQKGKYHVISLRAAIYTRTAMNKLGKQKWTHRLENQTPGYHSRENWGRDKLAARDEQKQSLSTKQIISKERFYQRRSNQHSVITKLEKRI